MIDFKLTKETPLATKVIEEFPASCIQEAIAIVNDILCPQKVTYLGVGVWSNDRYQTTYFLTPLEDELKNKSISEVLSFLGSDLLFIFLNLNSVWLDFFVKGNNIKLQFSNII